MQFHYEIKQQPATAYKYLRDIPHKIRGKLKKQKLQWSERVIKKVDRKGMELVEPYVWANFVEFNTYLIIEG